MNEQPAPHSRDKWIPAYIVLFFLVFIVVDAIMVTIAIDTNTGTVTDQPYEKGLAYNKTLDAMEEQRALHWNGKIDFQNYTLNFDLFDATGARIKNADVKAKIERPATSGMDQIVSMNETKPGHYEIKPEFPKPGLWNVRVFATWQEHTYQQATSLTIRP